MSASGACIGGGNERKKPGKNNLLILGLPALAVILFTAIGYFFLGPFLTVTHIPLTSFLLMPMGIIFILVWIIGVVLLWIEVSLCAELWSNPLTDEEENDPLVREVFLTGSFDEVFDHCLKAPYAVGRWWWVLPDRPKMTVSAWWTGIVLCHIRISLQKLTEDRYRVVLTGSRYFQWYEKTGSPATWERHPEHAVVKDMNRRKILRLLNGIQGFLLTKNMQ